MISKSFCRAVLAVLSMGFASAQELRVDINRDSKNSDSVTETGYTKWSPDTTGGATTGTNAATKTFTNAANEIITVSFSQTQTSADRGGAGLLSNWYQIGAQGTAKLVSDGFTVSPATLATGGQIQMTITGLAPGRHSLLTYHNHWDALTAGTLGPMDVFLNGTLVIDNLQPTIRAAINAAAPVAYVEFDVTATNDVTTIVFAAETNTSSSVTIKNPVINGFEIDTSNAARAANTPSPANGDEHVNADAGSALLSWAAATSGSAVSHDVYFGNNYNAVKTATHASPEFKGNQPGLSYLATGLKSFLTYYWRVDEIDATASATKGAVWYFRARHLAFPGAEGYGRFARGGRGGVVVEVTNLNDSGPGSLRDALTGNYGPRTVVFTVSGLITLESDLILGSGHPYITLAGQTAPGKGICTRKYQLGVSGGRDLIIRHIRSRPGNLSGTTLNGTGLSGSDHCIMDHISVSWGIDEELSTRTSKNVTFQRSLISEALNIAGHQNYPAGTKHGYAATVGGDIASLHHNLLAHNEGRNWSLGGGLDAAGHYAGRLDIFNNVVYNWGGRTTDGGAHEVNFVGNYYKKGPASTQFYALIAQYGGFPGTQQYYFTNNVMPGHFGYANQSAGRTTTTENGGTLPENSTPPYSAWVNAPFFPSYATIHHATNASKQVLSDVGCTQPQIDDHDLRVIRETIDGTYTYVGSVSGVPGLPDSQNDVGGWEDYGTATRPAGWDTDHDGLPDWWETIKGLNPNSPAGNFSDSNGDPDGDQYTNLEDYLNWLAAPHFDCPIGTPLDVDLTQFTSGFTNNSPVYTVNAATNGTVTLVGNNRTARFTPTVSTNALGSFRFTVTDAQGDSLTNTVGLRIMTAIAPAQPPILGIRNQTGSLLIELTGENGRNLTVQSKTNLSGAWLDWTNITGNGALQLLPLNSLTNQAPRYFRAFAQ